MVVAGWVYIQGQVCRVRFAEFWTSIVVLYHIKCKKRSIYSTVVFRNNESYRRLHHRMWFNVKTCLFLYPDSKVHGANMGPTWVMWASDGPHVGPMNLTIRVYCLRQAALYAILISALMWQLLQKRKLWVCLQFKIWRSAKILSLSARRNQHGYVPILVLSIFTNVATL